MKSIQWKPIKLYGLLIIVLFSIIIYTPACQEETGSHHSAHFILKGTVLSDTLEKPLEGITVIMQSYKLVADSDTVRTILLPTDSAITNIDGFFEVIDSLGIPAETTYELAFIDTGKILKASNERIDTVISYRFTNLKFTDGDGHWYAGKTFKTHTFTLEVAK